jgi:hypothetical protein
MSCSQSTRIFHHEWRKKMSAVGTGVMLLKDPTPVAHMRRNLYCTKVHLIVTALTENVKNLHTQGEEFE